jgi:uncharacterized 2Fe-2S/4Fe-4S cluster protein (DUF4445 family)
MIKQGDPVKLMVSPDNLEIEVAPQANLMTELAKVGVMLTSPCGGEGTCQKCRVIASEGQANFWLACQTKIECDLAIEVPLTSRASEMRILAGGTSRKVTFAPAIVKRFAKLSNQTLQGSISEIDLLIQTLDLRADLKAECEILKKLPIMLRKSNRGLTAITCQERILDLELGDTSDIAYGLALDIGTTTIVGTLVDLSTGKDLAVSSTVNRQAQHGHDVIARIKFSMEKGHGLNILQELVKESVNQILIEVAETAEVDPYQIYEATIAGNTTMSHLMLGVSPESLGSLPYTPVFSNAINVSAIDIGLKTHPKANVHFLPNIGGYVGSDTIAAILATELDQIDSRTRMLIDIGTNCEIVLRRGGNLFACSTPAGPAFEGAKINCGMYAGDGAIERVSLNDDCQTKTIGGGESIGICGSGIVDIGSELLRTGIVDFTGRMLPKSELPDDLPKGLRERVIDHNGEIEYRVTDSTSGQPIVFTQRDMRELQLAKAAIRSGIDVLIKEVGIAVEDLDQLLIAGGFGSYLNKVNAIRLGLIPDLPHNRIKIIGNAAITGAKLALISQDQRRRGQTVASEIQHLQIAETPDFQAQFIEAMIFELRDSYDSS